MKVRVDKSTCIGCAACEALCPEVFRVGKEGTSETLMAEVPAELHSLVREAANSCPVSAIEVEE